MHVTLRIHRRSRISRLGRQVHAAASQVCADFIFVVAVVACAMLSGTAASAATLQWTGAAGDNNIGTAGNWNPAQSPAAGDVFIFTGSAGLAPQRSTALSIGSITFNATASAFTLGGAGVYTIASGGVANDSAATQTINNPVTLGAAQTWAANTGVLSFGGAINNGGFLLTVGGNANTTINSIISGAGGLTKNGTGTLTLSGPLGADNTFTGDTTVNAGTLVLAKGSITYALASAGNLIIGDGIGTDTVRLASALQTGGSKNVVINSSGVLDLNNFNENIGTLTMTGGSVTTGTGQLKLGGNFVSNAAASAATIAGKLDLGIASRTFTIADGGATADLDVSAVVLSSGGAFGLTKAGSGTMVLSGVNTYTGVTTINGGVLRISADTNLGAAPGAVTAGKLTLNGGTLATTATFTLSSNRGVSLGASGGTFDTTAGTTLTYGGIIAGTGRLTKRGAGTLVVSGANTYTGGAALNGGILNLGSSGALGRSGSISFGGGTLQYSASNATDYSARFSTAANQAYSIDTNARNVTLGTALTSSGGSLTKAGAGTLTLSGAANTFTGETTVNAGTLALSKTAGVDAIAGNLVIGDGIGGANADVVQLTADEQIRNTSAVQINSSGKLDLNDVNETIGSLSDGTSGGGSVVTGIINAILPADRTSLTVGDATSTSFSGTISGTGNLVKTGSGTLTLSGANSYAGSTTISGGGVLSVTSLANGGSNSGIGASGSGAGLLLLNGGTLRYTGAAVSTNRLFSLGTGTTAGVIDGSGSGAVTFTNTGAIAYSAAGTRTLTLTGSTGGSLTPIVGDSGGTTSLSKSGGGSWTLGGANTYTGATTLSGGVLSVATIGNGGVTGNLGAASNAAGNLIFDGGTLQYTGATASTDRNFTINSGRTATIDVTTNALTLAGASTATNGGLSKGGAGTLILSGANAYTGATNINAGTLKQGAGNVISDSSAVTVATGATYDLNGFSETVGSLAGGGTVTSGSAGTPTLTAGAGNTSTVFSGVMQNGSGTVSLIKSGTGTLTLSGANTYTGGTTINGGTVVVNSAASLGAASGGLVLNAGTLEVATGHSTSRSITLGSAASTVQVNPSQTFTISTGIGGAGALNKTGTGTMVLSNANTFTGDTTVSSGTLNASADAALGSTAKITVSNGGTLLLSASTAGNNRVSNAAEMVMAGGILNTGGFTESVGKLTLTANSTTDFGNGTSHLTFEGVSSLGSSTLTVVNWSGTVGNTGGTDRLLFKNSAFTADTSTAQIRFDIGGSFYDAQFRTVDADTMEAVAVTAVPEPGTIFGAGLLGLVILWRERGRIVALRMRFPALA